jgi:transposase
VPLPEFLQPCAALKPDLRLANIHGELLPVLDYKVQIQGAKKKSSPYFLTVDWGIRKLLTVCVFDKDGNQVCPPIFLNFEPIQQKLLRIRKEIDELKAQRDSLPKHSSLWKKYNKEIARRWRKFRAIQKELAHLAANVIVLIAQIYNCSAIYTEWLKSLKSTKYSRRLNWLINTTVRQAIYDLVAYKAALVGIELKRPVQPYGTSQYCPRCGKKGIHTKSAHDKQEFNAGGWFFCPSCGFNADRDYVACCNLARKVLYGNLRDLDKGISYTAIPISDSLFRQSKLPRERLHRHLNGWKEVISLTPQRHFCGTLRS